MSRQQKTPAPGKGVGGSELVPRGSERFGTYTNRGLVATLTLRSIINDDGHFQGLEVARG